MSHPYLPIRKLTASDPVEAFDCGHAALNQFLQRHAWASVKAGSMQTYACCTQRGEVAGFYSLVVGSVSPIVVATRVLKGLARHPVPVMLLARLAVDLGHQRVGLGRALLKDALMRTAQAAEIPGIRCMLVHAKDDAARRWYEAHNFEPSPTNRHHLLLLLQDTQRLLSGEDS